MTTNLRSRTSTGLAAAVAVLALVGCNRNVDPTTTRADGRPDSVARAPDASRRGVDGTASDRTGRYGADTAAAGSSGVGNSPSAGMADRSPAPNPASDAGITSSVRAALSRDPVLRSTQLDVETVDGRVALTGAVPSAQDRERATEIASAVAGVRAVDNQLKVGAS